MPTLFNYTGVPIEVTYFDSHTNNNSTINMNSGISANINNSDYLHIKNIYGDVLQTKIGNVTDPNIFIAAQRSDGSPIMLDTVVPRFITPVRSYKGKIIAMSVSGFDSKNNKKLISAIDKRICPLGICRVDDEIWIIIIIIFVLSLLVIITIIMHANYKKGLFVIA
jgi:hypothetical protein